MRTLIIITVILYLVVTVKTVNEYKFGDIISFKRSCGCIKGVYKHFAVFVGDRNVNGKLDGQDIFHRKNKSSGACVFDTLDPQEEQQLDNYLDGPNIEIDSKKIQVRIKEKYNTCPNYKLTKKNCEHLATYIRYGLSWSEQRETRVEFLMKICNKLRGLKRKTECDAEKLLQELQDNQDLEDHCLDCSVPAG